MCIFWVSVFANDIIRQTNYTNGDYNPLHTRQDGYLYSTHKQKHLISHFNYNRVYIVCTEYVRHNGVVVGSISYLNHGKCQGFTNGKAFFRTDVNFPVLHFFAVISDTAENN